MKIAKGGKEKKISMQRDILGKLVSISSTNKSVIDIEGALSYPLAPISMPLSNSDGIIRKYSSCNG